MHLVHQALMGEDVSGEVNLSLHHGLQPQVMFKQEGKVLTMPGCLPGGAGRGYNYRCFSLRN